MRIVFAGTPEFAAGHLLCLLEHSSHEIVAVFTQPDRPAGRGKKLTESPVKALAYSRGLTVRQPLTLRDAAAQQQLADFHADIMVVVAYGLILPKPALIAPRYGCINVHASLLPRWRGAAPIQRAIEAGDTKTGITIMQMDEGLDTGNILISAACAIDNTDTAVTLHDKLLTLGCDTLLSALDAIEHRKLQPQAQDNNHATYAPKITKAEARLDWSQSAAVLERKIRAFNPFPVAYFELDGQPVRIWQARHVTTDVSIRPGTILSANAEGIQIATGQQVLLIQSLQLPGKKPFPVADVLNGYANWFPPGKVLH